MLSQHWFSRTDILGYTLMHKRLVSGCSLDVAKNSDLYLEQFISSSDRLLKWECFISLYCWVPWDLFFEANQLLPGRSGWEGWFEFCHCSWHRPSVLTDSAAFGVRQERIQSVFFEPSPFVRGHWFPKHHQCDGNKRELLCSAFINC